MASCPAGPTRTCGTSEYAEPGAAQGQAHTVLVFPPDTATFLTERLHQVVQLLRDALVHLYARSGQGACQAGRARQKSCASRSGGHDDMYDMMDGDCTCALCWRSAARARSRATLSRRLPPRSAT